MTYATIERFDDVAVVWLDQPDSAVNTLSQNMLEEFGALLTEIENDSALCGAVLISRKPNTFIAGADIEGFAKMEAGAAGDLSRQGNELLTRLNRMSKCVVAAIHGAALGGGLEVALACHRIIASDDKRTVLGVPEVKLGLLPGGGGTQRLPRRVGLRSALDMLLTGKNIYAHKARRMGLVDEVIHRHGLLQAAIAGARGGLRARPRRKSLLDRVLEGTSFGRNFVLKKAGETVARKTFGLYPAPPAILRCVRSGLEDGIEKGLQTESKEFDLLHQSSESQQLVQLFLSMQAKKHNPHPKKVKKVEHLAMIGAGFMGAGIAEVSMKKGIAVTLQDISEEGLGSGERTIWKNLSRSVKRRAMTAFERDRMMALLTATTELQSAADSDIVVEAVFEDIDLKRKILADVESACGKKTIFASNTSSLPIADIGKESSRPQLLVGMHYFSPVPKMPLLEVIRTPETADWVVATAVDLGIRQGKTVIVVGDGPGFYTTRILSAFMHEALALLEEGAEIKTVDLAMRRFGFPVGPVTLMDEVGIDVGAHIARGVLTDLFKARDIEPSETMQRMADAGLHGRKTGKGFYLYPKKRGAKKSVNQDAYRLLGGRDRCEMSSEEIQQRLVGVMVNEAVFCLQEEILSSPEDGDLGAVLGLGFPPFLGGPFRYLDAVGADQQLKVLEKYEEKFGARFAPAQLLRDQVGKQFHS